MKLTRYLAAFLLLFGLTLTLQGCSKDEPVAETAKEGVIFRFQRKAVYKTGVNEIGSVKISLYKGSEKITLPSLQLSGTEDQVQTPAYGLAPGSYEIISYTAYDKKHNYLYEMELETEDQSVKTFFEVTANEVVTFTVPVRTREILNANSYIRNALMGLCQEVFGEDDSLWPWDPAKYPYPDWEGLEFEFDDYGNPMYIAGIYFNGLKDGKPTPWAQMTEVPTGTISRIATIQNLTCTDLPNLRKLPEDLHTMPEFFVLTMVNTGLEELPANLSKCTKLGMLSLVNCQFKELPAAVSELKELRLLHVRGNQIAKIETPLNGLPYLESVDFSENPLESIGENVFAADGKVHELVLRDTKLSSLPAVLANMGLLRRVDLTGSNFSGVPSVLKNHKGLKELRLVGNPISGFTTADFSGMTNLTSLYVQGLQLGTFPRLENPMMLEVNLTGCGLTAAPDLSALPDLRAIRLGANKFTSLPADYFINNPKMRIVTLSDSPQLTSFGSADLGLKALIALKVEGVKWMDVDNCPALTWQTPAAWDCFDYYGGGTNVIAPSLSSEGSITRRPDIPPSPIDPNFGRVAVNRQGSPKVTFGK